MIVYYNVESGNITGMSYKHNPDRIESYFETDDPIAEKIFLGQEKSIKYVAVVRPGANQEGFIKLRQSSSNAIQRFDDRVIKITNNLEYAELTITQDCILKTVSVKIVQSSHKWWVTDNYFSSKKLIIVACKKNDPYTPFWYLEFTPEDLHNFCIDVPYSGTDNISFYTTRLFDSYKHEIKSSRN